MMTGLGMFTAIHTLLSIAALVSGVPVIAGLLGGARSAGGFWVFWMTAVATSVTGFFFPFHGMTPAIGVGVIALIILVIVLFATPMVGRSRPAAFIHAIGLVASEYLLVFVTIAQAFGKIAPLRAAAPTLKEPPFQIVQLAALVVFVIIGVLAVRKKTRVVRL
jgi:hypothetical protein